MWTCILLSLQTSTRASASTPPQNAPQLRPWTPHPCATNYVFPPSPAWAENSMVSIRGNEDWQMAGFSPGLMSANQIFHIFNANRRFLLWCNDDWSLIMFINRELGIETVAPYPPSGHLHSHLPHYHPPPRLHHFPIPFMVRVKPSAHMHTLI